MQRQAFLVWVNVVAFFCLVAPSYAETTPAVSEPTTPQKDTETLHFPIGHSLGKIVVFCPETAEDQSGRYTDRRPCRTLGEAQGDVVVPLGEDLGLAPSPFESYEPGAADVDKLLSRVTQLYTCGVFTYQCDHQPQDVMTLAPHMPRLRSVQTSVLNKGLIEALKTLPNVKELHVVDRLPRSGMESLADLQHVERLGLSTLPESLAPFGAIPNLKVLDLLLRGGQSNLHALDSYTERESVGLRLSLDCSLSQKELEYLCKYKTIEGIHFYLTAMACQDQQDYTYFLRPLSQLPRLRYLVCGCCGYLNEQSMDDLTKLTSLNVLEMRNVQGCTDTLLQRITPLSSLTYLAIDSKNLTDACLPALQVLSSLKTLVLWRSHKISPEGLAELRKTVTVLEDAH